MKVWPLNSSVLLLLFLADILRALILRIERLLILFNDVLFGDATGWTVSRIFHGVFSFALRQRAEFRRVAEHVVEGHFANDGGESVDRLIRAL